MLTEDHKKFIRKSTDVVIWRGFAWLGAVVLLTWAINAVTGYFQIGFDSTDGETRSGMQVLVDAKTNCQYLHTPSGGLTPRLTSDGKPICNKEK